MHRPRQHFPGLGEVVLKLGKLSPKLPRNTYAPELKLPFGAKFVDASFTCAAGTRTYKAFVPSARPARPRGLIVMLHGCTQNAADFAAGTRMNEFAENEGMLVVYPNQTSQSNSSGCWNWFNPRDQIHGRGEPSIIAGLTSDLILKYDINPAQVFVAGLSAGGAMAVIMGHTYPELYSAIGVHSGLPYQSANDVISAFAAMRGDTKASLSRLKPKVIVFHGEADTIVHPSNARAIASVGHISTIKQIDGVSADGRKYTRTIVEDDDQKSYSELWILQGAGHAWSGGSPAGSYTDSKGPDASREMMRFFLNREDA